MADPQLDGAELAFPISFDLRIIYVLAEGAAVREDIERVLAERAVPWTLMQGVAKPGARYGRFGVRLTMASREQMYATYEDIGRLPYVKTVI
jgi:putative lipoic acid-binding regulatory protein